MNSTGEEERPDNDGVTQQGEFGAVAKKDAGLVLHIVSFGVFLPKM